MLSTECEAEQYRFIPSSIRVLTNDVCVSGTNWEMRYSSIKVTWYVKLTVSVLHNSS
jgi:hypothetical protein